MGIKFFLFTLIHFLNSLNKCKTQAHNTIDSVFLTIKNDLDPKCIILLYNIEYLATKDIFGDLPYINNYEKSGSLPIPKPQCANVIVVLDNLPSLEEFAALMNKPNGVQYKVYIMFSKPLLLSGVKILWQTAMTKIYIVDNERGKIWT